MPSPFVKRRSLSIVWKTSFEKIKSEYSQRQEQAKVSVITSYLVKILLNINC